LQFTELANFSSTIFKWGLKKVFELGALDPLSISKNTVNISNEILIGLTIKLPWFKITFSVFIYYWITKIWPVFYFFNEISNISEFLEYISSFKLKTKSLRAKNVSKHVIWNNQAWTQWKDEGPKGGKIPINWKTLSEKMGQNMLNTLW
jgi:hypothetical protein